MKQLMLLVLVATLGCALCGTAFAQPVGGGGGAFGLGAMLGEPTGLSAKLWLGQTSAVDAVVAWSFTRNPALTLHADYLFHFLDLLRAQKGRLPLFVGVGAALSLSEKPDVGIRFPAGAGYLFETIPLELAIEVAPVLLLFPATVLDIEGGLSIRYYFPRASASKR